MSVFTDFTRILDALDTRDRNALQKDENAAPAPISEENYRRVMAYVSHSEVGIVRAAHAVSRRGIAGADSAVSLTRMARDILTARDSGAVLDDKKVNAMRSTLSQWAGAWDYVLNAGVEWTPETVTAGKRLYTANKDGRAHRDEHLPAVADLDTCEARTHAFIALGAEVLRMKSAASKKDAGTAPAPTEEDAPTEETREARPADGADVTEVTAAWVDRLVALAREAGDDQHAFIALDRDQRKRVRNLLAFLETFATEDATVNA